MDSGFPTQDNGLQKEKKTTPHRQINEQKSTRGEKPLRSDAHVDRTALFQSTGSGRTALFSINGVRDDCELRGGEEQHTAPTDFEGGSRVKHETLYARPLLRNAVFRAEVVVTALLQVVGHGHLRLGQRFEELSQRGKGVVDVDTAEVLDEHGVGLAVTDDTVNTVVYDQCVVHVPAQQRQVLARMPTHTIGAKPLRVAVDALRHVLQLGVNVGKNSGGVVLGRRSPHHHIQLEVTQPAEEFRDPWPCAKVHSCTASVNKGLVEVQHHGVRWLFSRLRRWLRGEEVHVVGDGLAAPLVERIRRLRSQAAVDTSLHL
eukprot:Hpha_TRINITY_DN15912_c4_g5::TRINITY_DN15912_c4_g5_i1::g.70919::m.70919